MEVVEVTESEITQRLVIEHNPLTTTIKWSISRMSPAVALGVLFRAAYSIFKDGFKKSANPQMAMNVLICYDHGTVTVKSDKSDDPTMLAAVIGMGMMTAANKMHDGGYESMFDES